MPQPHVRHLVITGGMGVGKSTTARAVAAELRLPHRDSDLDIERLVDRTGRQIAESDGVSVLHRLEAAVLLGALADPASTVVSAAASVVEDPLCREALSRAHLVVVLTLDLAAQRDRISSGDHRRSILAAELAALDERRRPLLLGVADLVLDAGNDTDELCLAITAAWADPANRCPE